MEMRTRQTRERKGEQGVVLAIVAIALLALILIAGMCIDISHLFAVRTELQNAADAAALSGASALNRTTGGLVEARQRATAEMNNYEFNSSLGQLASSNFYIATSYADLNNVFGADSKTCEAIAAETLPATVKRGTDTGLNPVQVRYVGVCVPAPTASQVSLIGSAIGSNAVALRGKAIAGLSPPPTGVCDILAPMALVYEGIPPYDPDDPNDPNDTFNSPFTGTQTYVLRDGPQNSQAPGNYQLLEICGPGGNNVRDALSGNCSGCFSIGENVCPKCGVTAGPVRQGWNARFDSDLVIKNDISYDDYDAYTRTFSSTNNSSSIYNSNGKPGQRIIRVPIVDKDSFGNGCGNCMPILDFAEFFLRKKVPGGNGGDITAEFRKMITVPSGEFGGTTPITAASLPVLYR